MPLSDRLMEEVGAYKMRERERDWESRKNRLCGSKKVGRGSLAQPRFRIEEVIIKEKYEG